MYAHHVLTVPLAKKGSLLDELGLLNVTSEVSCRALTKPLVRLPNSIAAEGRHDDDGDWVVSLVRVLVLVAGMDGARSMGCES